MILSNQSAIIQATLEVRVYLDGGTGEICIPTWTANNMAAYQFTSAGNALQLNIDITNNLGGYIFCYVSLCSLRSSAIDT